MATSGTTLSFVTIGIARTTHKGCLRRGIVSTCLIARVTLSSFLNLSFPASADSRPSPANLFWSANAFYMGSLLFDAACWCSKWRYRKVLHDRLHAVSLPPIAKVTLNRLAANHGVVGLLQALMCWLPKFSNRNNKKNYLKRNIPQSRPKGAYGK